MLTTKRVAWSRCSRLSNHRVGALSPTKPNDGRGEKGDSPMANRPKNVALPSITKAEASFPNGKDASLGSLFVYTIAAVDAGLLP